MAKLWLGYTRFHSEPDVGNGTTPLQVWSMANFSLSNIHLFLHFLCHPYILTIFVENFYCSLVSALFVEHKFRNMI